MKHKVQMRVYYEDTDAGGVVYHSNYLKFAERGRTELLRELGFGNKKLWDEQGIGFVVKNLTANFVKPARLDDLLTVETCTDRVKNSSFIMKQSISSCELLLFEIEVRIACVGKDFRPTAIPAVVKQALASNYSVEGN